MRPPRIRVPGVGAVPPGYVLGRQPGGKGAGAVQLLPIAALAQNAGGAAGVVVGPQSISAYAVGNTTGTASSAVMPMSDWRVSATGAISAAFSGSTLVLSVATATATVGSATSMGQTALGNTAGTTSSQTHALTDATLSFAGIVSGGFSGGTLIISGSSGTTAASGTTLSRFAIGNTTGSTTSDVATLTQWTISGAGGLSAGMSGGTLILSGATTAAQSVQTLGVFAVGNTTTSVSSMTADARSLSFDGAGIVSVGMSGGSIVISASSGTTAASATSMNMTAIGNTTGSSSATTRLITEQTLSGAGIVSVGYSGNSIIISASSGTTAASGTVQNRFALGNTTAAASSFAGTLSILSVSGAGGVSAGYDTNGVLVVSGATGGAASATSMGLSAVGNTAGSTSSMTNALTAETLVGSGAVRVGFSGGSIVISGDTGTALGFATMTYWEPRSMAAGAAFRSIANGSIPLIPMALPAAVSINQVRFVMSRSLAGAAGTIVMNSSAAASGTATASAFYNVTENIVRYTNSDATTFSSIDSTSMVHGATWSWSASRSGSSFSASLSLMFGFGGKALTTLTETNTGAINAATGTISTIAPGNTTNYTGIMVHGIPWQTSFGPGFMVFGHVNVSSGTGSAVGATWLAVTPGSWPGSSFLSMQGGAGPIAGFLSAPGAAGGATYKMPYGGGAIGTQVGSTAPATFATNTLGSYGAAGYDIYYMDMGVL